jgi:hypothetical protein
MHPLSINGSSQRVKPKGSLNFKHVLAASLIASGVVGKVRRIKAQLFGDESAHLRRWLLALLKYPPRKS